MKKYLILTAFLCCSLALGAAVLVFTGALKMPWGPVRITQVYSELIRSSESSLMETARYRIKLVFPYDFVQQGDEVDWSLLQWYYNRFPLDFAAKSDAEYYPDRTLPREWKYGGLYRLCREAGIDPAGRSSDFVVISVSARAGFDFSETSLSLAETFSGSGSPNRQGTPVRLTLPKPQITSIIVEDRTSGEEGFPEVFMTPAQWSLFIGSITPQIKSLAEKEGILETAAEGAEHILTNLFQGAGIGVEEIEYKDS